MRTAYLAEYVPPAPALVMSFGAPGEHVAGLVLPNIFLAGDAEAAEIILGRDVLNRRLRRLDGPALQTDILDDATAVRRRARKRP